MGFPVTKGNCIRLARNLKIKMRRGKANGSHNKPHSQNGRQLSPERVKDFEEATNGFLHTLQALWESSLDSSEEQRLLKQLEREEKWRAWACWEIDDNVSAIKADLKILGRKLQDLIDFAVHVKVMPDD